MTTKNKKRDYHAIIKIYDVNKMRKMRIAERVHIYEWLKTISACYEHCSIEYPEAEDDEEVELLREALKKKKND